MVRSAGSSGAGPLAAYYLYATPAFLAVDALFGAPVRVAGLPGFGPRLAYYLFLIGLGLLVLRRPRLGAWVGMGESVANLFLLLLSVLLPIWTLPGAVMAGEDPAPLVGPWGLVNVLLSGGVFIWSFHGWSGRALVATPGRNE